MDWNASEIAVTVHRVNLRAEVCLDKPKNALCLFWCHFDCGVKNPAKESRDYREKWHTGWYLFS